MIALEHIAALKRAFGVPVNSANGYRTAVDFATLFDAVVDPVVGDLLASNSGRFTCSGLIGLRFFTYLRSATKDTSHTPP